MLGSETARRVLSPEKKIQKLARLDGETQINIKREKIRSENSTTPIAFRTLSFVYYALIKSQQ